METVFHSRGATFALTIRMLALAAALAMLLCACGGNTSSSQTPPLSPSVTGGSDGPVTPAQDTGAQVAEVLAAQAPDGVDAALWAMLRDELARELGERQVSQTAVEELPEWSPNYFVCNSSYVDGARLVEWDNSFFKGDGSQNGVVEVADLVPIARHYGQSASDLSAAKYADYNNDYYIDISDISVLAMNFGKTCSSFNVEISVTARRSGYSTSEAVSYTDWHEKLSNGFAGYRHEYSPNVAKVAWIRITANDAQGAVLAYDTCVLKYDSGNHPYFPVDDLEVLNAGAGTITWSSSFLAGDGDGSGWVGVLDVTPLSINFGKNTAVDPSSMYADYDRDGVVGILDLDCWYDYSMQCCSGFLVEISTTSAASGYSENGSPAYDDIVIPEINEFGFRVFEYTIASPPEGVPYWVRVTPMSEYSTPTLGLPSDAVQITP